MKTNKSLFLGLLLLLTVLLFFVLLYFIYFLANENYLFLYYSLLGLVLVLLLATSVTFLSFGMMFFSLWRGTSSSFINYLVKKMVVFLFPPILYLGRLLRIPQEKIERSFIDINNRLFDSRNIKVEPRDLLILLPHCLQDENCPHKITRDPFNCRRCGRCPIDGLLCLAEKWRVQVNVATGGTLAREALKEARPKCVLAVACERDLSSGIVDSFPLPVCGILNYRPIGPCRNTLVPIETVEKRLLMLLTNGPYGNSNPMGRKT